MAPPTPDDGNTARFFCKFSSRLSFLSCTILSSLFLRASSASTPFLKSFRLRSFLLVGREPFMMHNGLSQALSNKRQSYKRQAACGLQNANSTASLHFIHSFMWFHLQNSRILHVARMSSDRYCASEMYCRAKAVGLTCVKSWYNAAGSVPVSYRAYSSQAPGALLRVCVVGSGPAGLYSTDRVRVSVTDGFQIAVCKV